MLLIIIIFLIENYFFSPFRSDWEWSVQDGGEGKTGRVMEIRGWDNESCRSVANVSWASGSTNVYRLGEFSLKIFKCLQKSYLSSLQ